MRKGARREMGSTSCDLPEVRLTHTLLYRKGCYKYDLQRKPLKVLTYQGAIKWLFLDPGAQFQNLKCGCRPVSLKTTNLCVFMIKETKVAHCAALSGPQFPELSRLFLPSLSPPTSPDKDSSPP